MKNIQLKYLLVVFFASFLIISCSEDLPVATEPTIEQQLQKALDDAIRTYPGKGISAALIFPEGTTWQGVAGISHDDIPVTNNMLFSAGSITKTFTAMIILQFAAEGILSLDDPLHKWFPPYDNIDSTITIRQILNHTGGIFDAADHPQIGQDVFADRSRNWTADDLLNNYVLYPYFEKETGWHYSSTGYVMLRKLIPEISGTDIATVYRNRLLTPQSLNDTYLYPYENLPGDVAHGWFDVNGDQQYDDITTDPLISFYTMAGGGIYATAMDLAKWAHVIFIDKEVITDNYYNQMIDFYFPTTGDPMVNGYGLGVFRFEPTLIDGLEMWGHGGDAIGYAAGSFYLPNYNLCLGIADNTEEGETMWVIKDLLTIAIDNLEE